MGMTPLNPAPEQALARPVAPLDYLLTPEQRREILEEPGEWVEFIRPPAAALPPVPAPEDLPCVVSHSWYKHSVEKKETSCR